MTWVLVLFVHVGMMGKGDSMGITNVPGFTSEQTCVAAGTKSKKLVEGTTKNLEFVCVKQQ